MERNMGRMSGGAVACGVAVAALLGTAGDVMGQQFGVGANYQDFFPPKNCWDLVSTTPIHDASGLCGCESGAPTCLQSSGSAGFNLDFSMYARHYSCACCSNPWEARVESGFNVPDLVISAEGQSGTVTASFSLDLFASYSTSYSCSNCDPPVPGGYEPDLPYVTLFEAVFGAGGPPTSLGPVVPEGWSSGTWTGQLNIGSTNTWHALVRARIHLGKGRQCQSSYGWADAVALVGPVSSSGGTIGPVFTFPDCPTCTANAPSIGLVDNYIVVPPGVCIGDLDGDNITNVFDFGTFAPNFGRFDLIPGTGGDMDYDGDCDVFDFGMWVADFGCGT